MISDLMPTLYVAALYTVARLVHLRGNMNLAGAANFSATDKDTISLYSDGSAWYETGRSVN